MHIKAGVARTRIPLIALAIVVAPLLAACGGDGGGPINTGPPPVPFTGIYDLHSISDSLLPHLTPHPQGQPFRVDSGHIKLNADMSYSYNADGKVNFTTFASAADTGTFSEAGSTITFTSKFLDGRTYAATATDTSLSVVLIGAMLGSIDLTIPVGFLKER